MSIKDKLPVIPDAIIIFIAGPVASGKTYLTKNLVDGFERSLILDNGANYLSPDYEHIWANPQELAQRLQSNPHYYRIAYHPKNKDISFDWCFASIWSLPQPRWWIIEEAHEYCAVNAIKESMGTAIRYARHNLLGIIATSQRIADVDKLLTSSARMTILFHTQEYRDIEAARLRWGRKVSEALEKLRPCIYDDVSQKCLQEPECLIITKSGFQVVELGTKILKGESQWEEHSQETQETQLQQSSELDSGSPEQQSQESISEAS